MRRGTSARTAGAYVHGSSSDEQDRLETQNRLLGGASFLPRLRPGTRVLDVGCGTGAVAREVAARVAPAVVVGVDRDAAQVRTARRLARRADVGRVPFRSGRAEALPFPDEAFDLVYARFVLEHVAEPVAVVREMARVARPGGTVVACECQVGCCSTTEPPLPSATKALDGLYRLQIRRGGNPYVGDRLEEILRDAGLGRVRSRLLTFTLGRPEQVAKYASRGSQMVRAVEGDLVRGRLVSRKVLDQAYREWEGLSRTAGAKAVFRLRRAQGTKAGSGR